MLMPIGRDRAMARRKTEKDKKWKKAEGAHQY
jgi:hypothetical protein